MTQVNGERTATDHIHLFEWVSVSGGSCFYGTSAHFYIDYVSVCLCLRCFLCTFRQPLNRTKFVLFVPINQVCHPTLVL